MILVFSPLILDSYAKRTKMRKEATEKKCVFDVLMLK